MPKGRLDGANETKGRPIGCNLGVPVLVGLAIGWLDGVGCSGRVPSWPLPACFDFKVFQIMVIMLKVR